MSMTAMYLPDPNGTLYARQRPFVVANGTQRLRITLEEAIILHSQLQTALAHEARANEEAK